MKTQSLPIIKAHIICLVMFAALSIPAAAENNTITVYPNEEKGAVNRMILGNNLLGYDPATYEKPAAENWEYADYGAGIWNPKANEPVKEAIDLAKLAGIKTARFPGGCGAHRYNWKEAIGKDRKHFLYGIDEFLRTCEIIGADPVLTLSYFSGNAQDAADLAEYLNLPADEFNPWARKRAENGHPLPYGVKYFEFGNEDWHGDHRSIKEVSPVEYAHRYLEFYAKMKEKDPRIMLGAILWGLDSEWDRTVIEILKNKIDFAVLHIYPNIELSVLEAKYEKEIIRTSELLKSKSGRDIPLAITEYNLGLTQDNPVPYRHSLAAALTNAELIRIFLKTENNILMAHYWNYINEFWGMVYTNSAKDYIKRPNYFVFELYNRHFGDILIRAGASPAEYLSVNAGKNNDGTKIYLMVINKNLDKEITCKIQPKDFIPDKTSKAWILNGPSIEATNEKDANNVAVKYQEFSAGEDGFNFTFEPQSLTAIEITGRAAKEK